VKSSIICSDVIKDVLFEDKAKDKNMEAEDEDKDL